MSLRICHVLAAAGLIWGIILGISLAKHKSPPESAPDNHPTRQGTHDWHPLGSTTTVHFYR